MDILQRLLQRLLSRQYRLTEHAIESMDEDCLTIDDLVSCTSTGRLRRSWPKQRKYEVEERAIDGRPVRIVARLIDADLIRIITAYEIK